MPLLGNITPPELLLGINEYHNEEQSMEKNVLTLFQHILSGAIITFFYPQQQ